mmetsp:Transcript_69639/g.163812  ORF Transcript_69639/g.163812 Transcript_69639/m.163812 type:complete len:291 (+) Transcript_69639:1-873(+)
MTSFNNKNPLHRLLSLGLSLTLVFRSQMSSEEAGAPLDGAQVAMDAFFRMRLAPPIETVALLSVVPALLSRFVAAEERMVLVLGELFTDARRCPRPVCAKLVYRVVATVMRLAPLHDVTETPIYHEDADSPAVAVRGAVNMASHILQNHIEDARRTQGLWGLCCVLLSLAPHPVMGALLPTLFEDDEDEEELVSLFVMSAVLFRKQPYLTINAKRQLDATLAAARHPLFQSIRHSSFIQHPLDRTSLPSCLTMMQCAVCSARRHRVALQRQRVEGERGGEGPCVLVLDGQ